MRIRGAPVRIVRSEPLIFKCSHRFRLGLFDKQKGLYVSVSFPSLLNKFICCVALLFRSFISTGIILSTKFVWSRKKYELLHLFICLYIYLFVCLFTSQLDNSIHDGGWGGGGRGEERREECNFVKGSDACWLLHKFFLFLAVASLAFPQWCYRIFSNVRKASTSHIYRKNIITIVFDKEIRS